MVSISGITSVAKSVYKYGKQILKATPELTFGTSAEAVGKGMRAAYKSGSSLSEVAKVGLKGINNAANKGNFLSKMCGNLKNLIPDISSSIQAGKRLATIKGKSSLWGTFKGLTKGVGKKLPFIFAALMLVGEVPNIIKATKEKGIIQGLKETIKPAVRLVGAGLGSAIGSAICPGIGSLVGWVAGEWLAGKIVGKSYSEKKAEAEEQLAQVQQAQEQQGAAMAQVPQAATPTQNPYSNYNPYMYSSFNNPYKDDIYMNQLPFNAIA